LLRLAAWSLLHRKGQPNPRLDTVSDAWMYEVFRLLEEHGHLDAICTETLGWSAVQIAALRTWLAQRP
jgi:hypothetical protein